MPEVAPEFLAAGALAPLRAQPRRKVGRFLGDVGRTGAARPRNARR
jgi:hypothetical protein